MTKKQKHAQVAFYTYGGELVEVDAGMFFHLEELKRLGVKTQFSCQGDAVSAYVLADWKSFSSLLKRIRRGLRKNRYDKRDAQTAMKLLNGRRTLQFAYYIEAGRNQILVVKFGRGKDKWTAPRIELTAENHYGRRITLRWPTEMSDDVLRLLQAT